MKNLKLSFISIIIAFYVVGHSQQCVTTAPFYHKDFSTIDKPLKTFDPSTDKNWTPILIDEFNTGSLDLTKWQRRDYDYQFPCSFNPNPSLSVVSGGTLKLIADWIPYRGRPISAGALGSIQTFGPNTYLETRVRIKPLKSSFPAFWIFDGSCGAKEHCEIDIFEYFGTGSWKNAFNSGVHYCYWNVNKPGGANMDRADGPVWVQDPAKPNGCLKNIGSPDVVNFLFNTNIDLGGWHTYAAFYQRENIYYYFDDILYKIYPNNAELIRSVPIWLNNAISDLNGTFTPTTLNTLLPNTFEVDYVRCYELNCDRITDITVIPNFNTFYWAVVKSYSLNNSTVIPPSTTANFIARDFIEFKDGFEIPSNADITATIMDCQ